MALLADLRAAGIGLRLSDAGKLRVTANAAVLTDELKASIRQNKRDLIAALKAEAASVGHAEDQRARLRTTVTETLDRNPSVRYAWLSEHDRQSDVVLAVAIRDVGSCELSIERGRYDVEKLLAIVAGEASTAAAPDHDAYRLSTTRGNA